MVSELSTTTGPPPFTPGIDEALPIGDYHAIDALSASGIKRLLQSPMHYRYDRANPRPDTAALAMGQALHEAVLTPHLQTVVVIPDDAPARPGDRLRSAKTKSRETLERIAWWDDFEKRAAGRTVLTEDQATKVAGMGSAVRAHPIVQLMKPDEGRAELTLQWADPRSKGGTDEQLVPCKCRFDWLRRDGIAIDLKSSRDASPEGFARQAAEYRYHLQAAWYDLGHTVALDSSLQAFIFVAVESEPPHGVACYVLDEAALRFAVDECERALLLYAEARRSRYWRGYSRDILPLHLPRWATSRNL